MTAEKVIEKVDKLKPNAFDIETKLSWLNDLEGKVKALVIQADEIKPLIYPDNLKDELCIPYPYDDLYGLYLESMIDYYNKEIEDYNNSAMLFEVRFSDYKKDYIRKHQARR